MAEAIWENTLREVTKYYQQVVEERDSKINFYLFIFIHLFSLQHKNEKIEAEAKRTDEAISKISILQSKFKLKNDQKRVLETKIKKLEKTKECQICFDAVSVDRKWTAFVPCGHRICNECAEKISSACKCPHCRKNIIRFLVLQGIYES